MLGQEDHNTQSYRHTNIHTNYRSALCPVQGEKKKKKKAVRQGSNHDFGRLRNESDKHNGVRVGWVKIKINGPMILTVAPLKS